MFVGTVEALASAVENEGDPIAAVDETRRLEKLLWVREGSLIEETGDVDPIVYADRHASLRKITASGSRLEFKSAHAGNETITRSRCLEISTTQAERRRRAPPCRAKTSGVR